MIKDVGIHCSMKHVTYVKRKRNRTRFEWLKEAIEEMNAVFSEMCEDFLIEDGKMMKVSRKRIQQVREEERENSEELNPELKQESSRVEGKRTPQGTYICNFFVVPIDRLRILDLQEDRYTEVGISVLVCTRINEKEYKCVELDLLSETLANSKWIDPNFLDYDFYLYRESLYPYLLRAIRLATRILDDDDEKLLFDDEVGWVERFYGENSDGYLCYIKDDRYVERKKSGVGKKEVDAMQYRAVRFLHIVQGYISKFNFLKIDAESDLSEGYIGWEDEKKWAFDYKLIKSFVTHELKRSGKNFKLDTSIYAFLYKQGILAIEGDVEGKFRPDTKFGNDKKRVFVLDKSRFGEYLSENQSIIE